MAPSPKDPVSTFDNFRTGAFYSGGSVKLTEEHRELIVGPGGYTHPLFTDLDYVKNQSSFPSAPVPGQFTLFLLGGMAENSGLFGDDVVALIAIDEVRFSSPALIGDTVELKMSLIECDRRPNRSTGTISLKWLAANHRGEEVLRCNVTMLVKQSSA